MKTEKALLVRRYTNKDHDGYLTDIFGSEFEKYRANWEKTSRMEYKPEFPLCLSIELIDSCNLSCSFCYRGSSKSTKETLGFDRFKRIVDEASEFGLPSLKIGMGEPFLEKRILKMVGYAVKKGVMDIIVTTNGSFLTEQMSKDILDSGVSRLRISVDASTEETYKMMRGGDLESLEQSIKEFLLLREAGDKVLPIVRLSFVYHRQNQDEVELFKEKWENVADYIEIQDWIDISKVDVMQNIDFENVNCAYPFQLLSVRVNGNIQACCNFFGKHLVMGNINDLSIKEAWDSEFMERLRKGILTKKNISVCKNCFGFKHKQT